eukprot:2230288-Rhodomonas_salina.3
MGAARCKVSQQIGGRHEGVNSVTYFPTGSDAAAGPARHVFFCITPGSSAAPSSRRQQHMPVRGSTAVPDFQTPRL